MMRHFSAILSKFVSIASSSFSAIPSKVSYSILDPLLCSINISPQMASSSTIILNTIYMWWIPVFIPIPDSSVNTSLEHPPVYSTSTFGCSTCFKLNMHKEGLLIFVHSYMFLWSFLSITSCFFVCLFPTISVIGTLHTVSKPKT